jgi:hypothetical protein
MKDVITIVSGLPRSGTSMMMRMLEAGGMVIVTDNIRKADDDNPRGYFEFERAKKIKEDSSWLPECRGKVVKMISALLYDLPLDNSYTYNILFMERDMTEVLASQKRMLERRRERGAGLSNEEMGKNFWEHLQKVQDWLETQKAFNVLYVNYNEVLANPMQNALRVNAFLEDGFDAEKMAEVVEQRLYRQRKR